MNQLKSKTMWAAVGCFAAATLVFPTFASAAGCSTGSKKCIVDIKVTGTPQNYKVEFDPDVLHVKENERGKEYCIVFKLPSGYTYKIAQGDGVAIKDPDLDEFYGQGASTDDNCSSSGKKAWRRFFWKYINSVEGRYSYKINFHDLNGNPYSGDPIITNVDSH